MSRFPCGSLSLVLASVVVVTAPSVGRTADPSPDLAQKAKAVLETNCYRCHGQDGHAEVGVYVLDRERLVARKKIAPGDAAKSKLYKAVVSGDMPLPGESPRPTKDDVEV